MSNFSPTGAGSQAISVYTKREEIVYGIFENELDSLSNYNMLSASCFSIGSLFFGKLIDSISNSVPFSGWYFWALLTFVPYIIGLILFLKIKGLTDKIKNKSKPIDPKTVADTVK